MPPEYAEMVENQEIQSSNKIDNNQPKTSLGDLFSLHKLNLPSSIIPDQKSMPGFGGMPPYLMPTNINPLITNPSNLNTSKPSNNSLQSSIDLDKKIRDIEEKKKITSVDLENLGKDDLHKLFKVLLSFNFNLINLLYTKEFTFITLTSITLKKF